MRKFILLTLICIVTIGTLGCRPGAKILTPRQDVTNYHVTAEQVKKVIYAECATIGWKAKDKDANTIIATILVRNKHTVVVEIPYTATSYSIKYVSSSNMAATSSGNIHPQYNNWVLNLSNAINNKLSFIGM